MGERQEGGDWTGTGEVLRDFLLHCTVREAVIGCTSKFIAFVDASEIKEALELFEPLKFVALASEEPQVRLWCSEDALVRMAPPPTGYAGPSEQLWMLTFAAPSDSLPDLIETRFLGRVECSGEDCRDFRASISSLPKMPAMLSAAPWILEIAYVRSVLILQRGSI
ncbi:hypothetical protein [Streptomyces sp. NPDC059142]|uniref:hypothetical protein n=1 Tax=Streptomyces sp. NPDC059142 TaxID=3346739 RepID=UPI0036B10DC4